MDSLPALLWNEKIDAAKDFASASKAPETLRAYRAALRQFEAWCTRFGLSSLPAAPETVAAFLADTAICGRSLATVRQRCSAIAARHRAAGLTSPTDSPVVAAVVEGIARTCTAPARRKAAATSDIIERMVAHCPEDTLRGKRDRAILLLGFAGAFRRSELAALAVEDLEPAPAGLRVTIRKSKTDQRGEGQTVAIIRGSRHCPVRAVEDWLAASLISSGRVFRRFASKRCDTLAGPIDPQSIAAIVKRYAELADLDPRQFGGHSLRAGFATTCAEAGADAMRISEVTRHKSLDVLRGYVRRADAFRNHALQGVM